MVWKRSYRASHPSGRYCVLHRDKLFLMILLIFFTCSCLWPSTADSEEAKFENQKNIFIKFYQDHISIVDGERCPMTPSCSEYASQAIHKHGFVKGWVMACDRLVRCGRDEIRVSPHVWINHEEYVSDSVPANDFWWFTQHKNSPVIQ